jgi:hypothetical protein
MKYKIIFAIMLVAAAAFAQDQAAPLLGPKPVFTPGQYETESRNSRFPDQPVKASVCMTSADFEAFRRETMDQYLNAKHFTAACRLSEDIRTPKGFAFAMDCGDTKIVTLIEFSNDEKGVEIVRDQTQTTIARAPQASSDILSLMRRTGDCKGGEAGKKL